ANDQVAELAVGIELVQEAVGIARPGDELVFHSDAGLGREVLGQLHQRIGRVPGRPAKGQGFLLRLSPLQRGEGAGGGDGGGRQERLPHSHFVSSQEFAYAGESSRSRFRSRRRWRLGDHLLASSPFGTLRKRARRRVRTILN